MTELRCLLAVGLAVGPNCRDFLKLQPLARTVVDAVALAIAGAIPTSPSLANSSPTTHTASASAAGPCERSGSSSTAVSSPAALLSSAGVVTAASAPRCSNIPPGCSPATPDPAPVAPAPPPPHPPLPTSPTPDALPARRRVTPPPTDGPPATPQDSAATLPLAPRRRVVPAPAATRPAVRAPGPGTSATAVGVARAAFCSRRDHPTAATRPR